MRGKLKDIYQVMARGRITPAYAGKTGGFNRNKTAVKDHPRVCGENTCYIISKFPL